MFGGSNISSSWANPQQNQQPPQTGAFGQPSAFGSSGTSAFGQTQPQQQPQANPMFGNLGGNTSSGTTGFGGFGSTNSAQTASMFGPKPATGFGAFGSGTSAFGGGGGGGTFGQTAGTAGGSGTSTGLFGQSATTNAFGSGLFTNKTSTFGTPTNAIGSAQPTAPVTSGSSNPPYAVFTEKDNTTTLQYQSISCMPAYQNTSQEEIRLQDYAQGRKTAGAFGQSATFGTTQPTSTGLFGAQPTQPNAQTSAFGSTNATSGFGTFGAPATNTTAPTPASTGIFGGGGSFGQPQPQQQQTQQAQGFGGFGAPMQQPQQQTSGLFGSAFGGNTPKPGGFGSFGGATSSNVFGGGNAFGQQPQQNQPQQTQPTGGLFGSAQPPATTGFGAAFGGTNPSKSPFGGTQPTITQPAAGFGPFGANQQPQIQQPAQQTSSFGGSGLFGSNLQPQQGAQQPAPNSLFGGATTTGQTGGPGLFGGGTGLFGSNTNPQQQQIQQPGQGVGFGSFGGKPAAPAGSLFGGGLSQQQPANIPQQQGLFGSSIFGQSTNQQSMLGGGFFGNKPAAPALGGSLSTGQGGPFGPTNATIGSFGASVNNGGAQGTLTASISQPIGSDLAIFDMLPPGPRLLNLEESQNKKKPGFFVDVPTRSPVPRVQLGYTPANSKLRGFSSSTSTSLNTGGNPLSTGLSFTSGSPNTLSLSRVGENKSLTPADAFTLGRSSSPSLGSGGKPSVKKVILDKKVEPTELFNKSGGSPGLRGGKVVFSPALSIAAREKDAMVALKPIMNGVAESPSPAPRPQRTPNRFTAQGAQQPLSDDNQDQATTDLEEGDYWVKPGLVTLKQAGYDELSSFKDLSVGRVGYGEIHFLEPVDLAGLAKLGALLGEVVRFDDKECSVYPDSEEVDKPPPGSGLNVQARLCLERCWAVDKATREPIKDVTDPVSVKHLKRLKNMKGTRFESFDITDGKWTFTVDHF